MKSRSGNIWSGFAGKRTRKRTDARMKRTSEEDSGRKYPIRENVKYSRKTQGGSNMQSYFDMTREELSAEQENLMKKYKEYQRPESEAGYVQRKTFHRAA